MSVAKCSKIYCNLSELQNALKTFTPSISVNVLDSTVLGDCADKRFEPGLVESSVNFEGLYTVDTTNLNQLDDILDAALVTGNQFITTVIPLGDTNTAAYLFLGIEEKHEVSAKVGELIMSTAAFKTQRRIERGDVLAAKSSQSGTNIAFPQLDNVTSTTNGGVMHVHFFSSPGANTAVQLQHSTDGTTWVDVPGGMAGTNAVPAVFRVELPKKTTVNRFVRIWFTGTATFAVAFARR